MLGARSVAQSADQGNPPNLNPARALIQIITAREERASIACASSAPFSEWGNTFTDPRLAAAVVDRLTFNAHIIQNRHKQLPARQQPQQEGSPPTPVSRPRVGPNQASTVGPNQLVILTSGRRPCAGVSAAGLSAVATIEATALRPPSTAEASFIQVVRCSARDRGSCLASRVSNVACCARCNASTGVGGRP